MPNPTIADQLKCRFVYTELPKYYSRENGRTPSKQLLAGIWNAVVHYAPAGIELNAKPGGILDMDIDMTDLSLKGFLRRLADDGPDVEKEFRGVLWKYVRVD